MGRLSSRSTVRGSTTWSSFASPSYRSWTDDLLGVSGHEAQGGTTPLWQTRTLGYASDGSRRLTTSSGSLPQTGSLWGYERCHCRLDGSSVAARSYQ
jgi:hypothetical protein